MNYVILAVGIIMFFIGLVLLIRGCVVDIIKVGAIGMILLMVSGAIIVLTPISIVKWEEHVILCELENGQYSKETEDVFLFKEITFSKSGEIKENYARIEKGENVSIEVVPIEANETPICKIFYNEERNLFGDTLSSNNKYIFYIPQN